MYYYTAVFTFVPLIGAGPIAILEVLCADRNDKGHHSDDHDDLLRDLDLDWST